MLRISALPEQSALIRVWLGVARSAGAPMTGSHPSTEPLLSLAHASAAGIGSTPRNTRRYLITIALLWPGEGAVAMIDDVVLLAGQAVPYMTAAAAAYGGAVLAKVRDDAADATVGLGRRLLQRVFGIRGEHQELPEPVQNLVLYPRDDDAVASLRLAVRRALATDPALAADVQTLLAGAVVTVTASGERSIAAQTHLRCSGNWRQHLNPVAGLR